MKRFLVFLLVLVVAVYLIFLGWSAVGIASRMDEGQVFSLDPTQEQTAALGEPYTLELQGRGFSSKTRVSMHMDVNNSTAIVASFPFDEIIFDMELVGNHLFFASNEEGLRSLDVSDPLKPVMNFNYKQNTIFYDIEQKDGVVYASCLNQGVRICRLLEQGRISKNWTILPTNAPALASKVVGNYLYVATSKTKTGLLVYDLERLDEAKPIAVIDTGHRINGIGTYKGYLYFSQGTGGVGIYQIGEGGVPFEIERLDVKKQAKSVTVTGDFLYFLDNGWLAQYDLREPGKPVKIVEQHLFSSPRELFYFDGLIVVTDNNSGIRILETDQDELSEPASFINLGGNCHAVVKIGHLLYISVAHVGIKVLDLDKLKPRQVVKTIQAPRIVKSFHFVGDYVYFNDIYSGLFYRDMSQQERPASLLTNKPVETIKQVGNYLYVMKKFQGIEIYNVTAPSSPRLVNFLPEIKGNGFAFDNNHYVSISGDGIELYGADGMNPPHLLDEATGFIVLYATMKDDLVIVACEREGVRLYRIENDQLVFQSRLQLPFPLNSFSSALKAEVNGNILFVANGDAGLMIADVKDPDKPEVLSSLNVPGQASDLLIEGEKLYLLSRYCGVHTIDISDLRAPTLLDTVSLTDVWRGLQRHGDLLYVGNRYMGVTAIPFPQEIENVDVLSTDKLRLMIPSPKFPGRYSLQVRSQGKALTAQGCVTFQ